MLFSSISFLIFLVIVYFLVFFAGKMTGDRQHQTSILLFASFFFYSWWNPIFMLLLLISIGVNFFLSKTIITSEGNKGKSNIAFYFGLVFNLGLIFYYKYAYFLVDTFNALLSMNIEIRDDIFLPLGISFFTFQQIAFLVDCRKGLSKLYNLKDYALFISFFPQLIAGPIVHHKEMMPQFEDKTKKLLTYENFSIGFVLFSIGLFKKLVLADNAALICDPYFIKWAKGASTIYFEEAWVGVIAYTFQIYFDFSGYCDMALGVARMFGIILPINFFSPYRSRNIVEFWRTWHITLSRFLRDYVYIALGGNRKGKFRRYVNLMSTMLVGGLWHGASWTFVVWGGLHGLYLVINHIWNSVKTKFGLKTTSPIMSSLSNGLGIFITFIAVAFAWVFFRATTFSSAFNITEGMLGVNGFKGTTSKLVFLSKENFTTILSYLPISIPGNILAYGLFESIFVLILLAIVVWFVPNSIQIVERLNPVIDPSKVVAAYSKQFTGWQVYFKPNFGWAVVISFAFVFSVLNMTRLSPFLYFQF